jgi:hypothetical protein
MRHGRKSKTKRFDGYKRHIGMAHGFIVATALEPANVPEHVPTERLLAWAAKHGRLHVVDIDRGHLASPSVRDLHRAGVRVNCRAWQSGHYNGLFTKKDFDIQLQSATVRCPAKKTAIIRPSGLAAFSSQDCGRCRLKAQCTTAESRTLRIHPLEDLMLNLRKRARTKAGRAELRKRTVIEHGLARGGLHSGCTCALLRRTHERTRPESLRGARKPPCARSPTGRLAVQLSSSTGRSSNVPAAKSSWTAGMTAPPHLIFGSEGR